MGDFASTLTAHPQGTNWNEFDRVYFPHSIGFLYTAITMYLGFPFYGDEYKVMGLAPYGQPFASPVSTTYAEPIHSEMSELRIRNLAAYKKSGFTPGRGPLVSLFWYFLSLMVFESGWVPVSRVKVCLLRLFGARVGRGVVLKPHVRIKFPWKLEIGDHCWIGQDVWIDNLDQVTIESDVCISQGAYLCTGSHDHKSPTFELRTGTIVIAHGAWLACRCIILQNVRVGRGAVVGAGRVVSQNVEDGAFLRAT